MIPQNITHNHILKALDEIDELGYPERRESTGFYLNKQFIEYSLLMIHTMFPMGEHKNFRIIASG
jgi:hypothetical protein